MKPCRGYQKCLALSAAGALTGADEAEVQRHTFQCAGCRTYKQSLVALMEEYRGATQELPHIELSEKFYEGIRSRVQLDQRMPPRVGTGAMTWHRRIAWGVAGLAVTGCLLFVNWPGDRERPAPISATSSPIRSVPQERNASTHFALRLAMSRSTEELDRMLAQAAPNSPAASETPMRLHSVLVASEPSR